MRWRVPPFRMDLPWALLYGAEMGLRQKKMFHVEQCGNLFESGNSFEQGNCHAHQVLQDRRDGSSSPTLHLKKIPLLALGLAARPVENVSNCTALFERVREEKKSKAPPVIKRDRWGTRQFNIKGRATRPNSTTEPGPPVQRTAISSNFNSLDFPIIALSAFIEIRFLTGTN